MRGRFIRGWDHGANIDPLRLFFSVQLDEFKRHQHIAITNVQYDLQGWGVVYNGAPGIDGSNQRSGLMNNTSWTGGTETRPKNIALLPCIKY